MKLAVAVITTVLLACSSSVDPSSSNLDVDASPFQASDANFPRAEASACDPPDTLIVLDRSDSMGASPGFAADGGTLPPKWTLAVGAVDAITAAPTDTQLRYGLEVLPKVSDRCGTGELLVPADLSRGATIASTLASTSLLSGTPIGGALEIAQTMLQAVKVTGRRQYVVLVTDGNETCSTNGPLPVVQALAAAGVMTYVVAFGDVKPLLNDLACAGMTAKNFSTSCEKTSTGYVSNGGTAALYFSALDGVSLKNALATIAGDVCCGCTVN